MNQTATKPTLTADEFTIRELKAVRQAIRDVMADSYRVLDNVAMAKMDAANVRIYRVIKRLEAKA